MNIFLHEMKSYRKTIIIWSIALAAIVLLFMIMFPGFASAKDDMTKMLSSYPPTLLKAIGADSLFSMFTMTNFYAYTFIYVSLAGVVCAMNIGLSIISKEISLKTADFLLTKPASRNKVIGSKICAGLVSLIIINIVFIAVSILSANIVNNGSYDMKIFTMIASILFFLQLIFFTMGFVIGVIAPKIRSVIGTSLGISFAFFLLGMVLNMQSSAEVLRYFVPFKYLDPQYIIANGAYETKFLILGIAVSVVFIIVSYVWYNKKDIDAV